MHSPYTTIFAYKVLVYKYMRVFIRPNLRSHAMGTDSLQKSALSQIQVRLRRDAVTAQHQRQTQKGQTALQHTHPHLVVDLGFWSASDCAIKSSEGWVLANLGLCGALFKLTQRTAG